MEIYIKVGEEYLFNYTALSTPRVNETIEYSTHDHFEDEPKSGCYEIEQITHHIGQHFVGEEGDETHHEVVLHCRKMTQEEVE